MHLPGEGLQVREHRHDADGSAPSADPPLTYERHSSDEDLGLWVYRHLAN